MNIVAGTFSTQAEARNALADLEKEGIAPVSMNLIEADDLKGFAREHTSTPAAARGGAIKGAILGVVIFGALLAIAGVRITELRYLALYVSGIALCGLGGLIISALWNMGVSHDEALLYEEAQQDHSIIAAVEVPESLEETVIHSLEDHGAHNVRAGNWEPRGWRHHHPTYPLSA